MKICDSYPLDARNIAERLVSEMETKMQVMRLIFADFNAYVDTAAADAKAKGDIKVQDSKDSKTVGVAGRYFLLLLLLLLLLLFLPLLVLVLVLMLLVWYVGTSI